VGPATGPELKWLRRLRDPAQRGRLERHHGPNTGWALEAWIGTWLSPAFAGWSLDAELPSVRCPVLAIHGDADEYGSTAHAARIAAGVGGPAETLIVAGGGHFPHRERPTQTAAPQPRPLPWAATTMR
jgi:pimeloyl-ACP methyl ester carboxylesterase